MKSRRHAASAVLFTCMILAAAFAESRLSTAQQKPEAKPAQPAEKKDLLTVVPAAQPTPPPGQRATVQALVPLAEISEYQLRLKALTGGEGAYAMELSHYDPVPARRQQQLVQAWRPHLEAE